MCEETAKVRLDAGQSACVDASAPETAGFDGLLLEGTRFVFAQAAQKRDPASKNRRESGECRFPGIIAAIGEARLAAGPGATVRRSPPRSSGPTGHPVARRADDNVAACRKSRPSKTSGTPTVRS